MTAASKRRRGFLATREGLAILEARRLEKGFTQKSLTEAAGFEGDDQVRRLFNPQWGYKVQRDAIEKIAAVLELQPTEFIEDWLPKCRNSKQKQTVMNPTDIDWREVCLVMLEQQQKEQRIRRKATEQGFEVKVYVPLGLVERKQQQRRSGILPMEEVHQLEKEVIIRTYKHNEFLNDVIGQKSADKNNHIAIVGEPGAGKTTLLDNIATHIQKNTEDLPICISLGSLQGKKLKDYILEEWLPEAIALTYPDIDVETFHQNSLQKRLRQGGVWLLLDGVDEMGETSPAKALESIQNQLTDWLGKVRVVLTCRTNVWDASLNNRLIGFNTYKTQHFDPADIRRFIKQWFGFAGKPELGKILRQKLNEPQRDRIRQLVENPLRLALLCQVFDKDKQAELPETKAGLYELFVRYFYEWKPTQCSIDLTTQPGLKEELHQALGRLSIAGLDSDARFRLPKSLIKKEMDDRLFTLAWQIGLLNLVDREATTDEPVYAFFHPTFQEYFAALAIDDWHFLLNHVPDNRDERNYRIFEPQWKEVYLLWLGQDNLLKNDQQKESLINALLNFDAKCHGAYCLKAFFLGGIGFSEYKYCNQGYEQDKIWSTLVQLAFGYFDSQKQTWITFRREIEQSAKSTLLQTDLEKASKALIKVINSVNDSSPKGQIKNFLRDFYDKNKFTLTKNTKNELESILLIGEQSRLSGKKSLHSSLDYVDYEIDFGEREEIDYDELMGYSDKEIEKVNQEWIDAQELWSQNLGNCDTLNHLLNYIFCNPDEDIRDYSIYILFSHLKENLPNCLNAIEKLLKSLLDYDNPSYVRASFIWKLAEIIPDNLEFKSALKYLMDEDPNIQVRRKAARNWVKINQNNSEAINKAINVLTNLLLVPQSDEEILYTAETLEGIDRDNLDAIKVMINLLLTSQEWSLRDFDDYELASVVTTAAQNLKEIQSIEGIELVIQHLKNWLNFNLSRKESRRSSLCHDVLWHYTQNMSYPDFYDAWHSQPPTTHPEAPDITPVGNSSTTQRLNFTQLPSTLRSAIADDKDLNKTVQLICIDGSQFSDQNNPAIDIYIEMTEQGCPEQQEEPSTMQQLKKYWRLRLKNPQKRVALLFYNSKADREFSEICLTALSTFGDGDAIAIITDQPCENLQTISPNDPDLIDAVLKWLRRRMLED